MLTPMLATAAAPPEDGDASYAVEWKWDGIRCLSQISGGVCRMVSRNANTLTAGFPEIARALVAVAAGREMVVDGELVAPDPETGVPRFARIGRRLGVVRPSTELIREIPVRMYLFDLLALDGEDLRGLPYLQRRERLSDLDLADDAIVVSPYFVDVPVARMLEVASEHGVEGIVAKRMDSPYRAGRSRAWLKVALRRTTEVVVVGWLPGKSGARGVFGSLLIAAHDEQGRLQLLGAVGSGFSDAARRALQRELDELVVQVPPVVGPVPRSVAPNARWVRARLIGDVEFRERTAGGLRHPVWRGLRFDRALAEVRIPE
ncbi:ATP-dependent DNA ligase [Nocardia brasiliensis]|uniref:ATP-dependent DNA ligase n=1 Tax=Nocardia brasiliensis TaxID=37326 RepID=UPI002458CF82|nr:ATP-dependent DNA ligase [Nocardia brasiliensis]